MVTSLANSSATYDTDALLKEAAQAVRVQCKKDGIPSQVVEVLEEYGYLKPFTSINPDNITYAVTPVVGRGDSKSAVDIYGTNRRLVKVHTGSPTYSGEGKGTRIVLVSY